MGKGTSRRRRKLAGESCWWHWCFFGRRSLAGARSQVSVRVFGTFISPMLLFFLDAHCSSYLDWRIEYKNQVLGKVPESFEIVAA